MPIFEKSLLGFSYSNELIKCFKDQTNLRNSIYINSTDNGTMIKSIGVVEDSFSRKSKNGNDYLKLTLSDEYGRYDAILVDGRKKNFSSFKEKSEMPEKTNIVVFLGSKGDDIIFLEELSIIDEKIYMKLSDLR